VTGDQIVLTTAIDTGKTQDGTPGQKDRAGRYPSNLHDYTVLSFDRNSGKELWRTVVSTATPNQGEHVHSTWASNSPVTDGKRIYAYFGSEGLHALDLEGKLLWSRDFGTLDKSNAFGEGSSPAIGDGKIVVQWDHEGQSFVAALDAASGEEIWRQDRAERTSWSTPLIVDHAASNDGRPQVITNATTNVRSYDLATGEPVWWTTGMTENVIPSPVHDDGRVFVMSGFQGYNLLAIGLEGASGDISGSDHVLWSYDRDTPYVLSPLLYQGTLYFFKVLTPILTAVDAVTGDKLFGPERLEALGPLYSSPVGAGGHVYFVGRKGISLVIKAGPKLEIVATNTLDDGFDASPVVVDDRIYLRGRKYLYAIGAD
jgi:outer membrane protein assembly factor BamB